MKRFRFISVLLLAVAALPAAAATTRDVVTTEQIAAAMNRAGMKVSAEQVVLLTDVVATTSAPALKVESMERWGDHRMRVRMDCDKREECLPFFVAVNLNQTETAQTGSAAPVQPLPVNVAVRTDFNGFIVRAGTSAILLIEGGHVHIQLPVICLENGASGQLIRVTSKDHKQTYVARVGEGAVLRAKL